MANFCPSCGNRLEPGNGFCVSCGAKLETGDEIIGQWEVKERDEEGYGGRRGTLLLTRNELIFLSRIGLFSKKQKEYCRIPLSKIKKVYKMPLFNLVSITYDKTPSKAGAFRRFFGKRNLNLKMENPKLFIEKIKELNPNVR